MSDRQEAQYTDSVPAMKDLLQSVVPKAMRQAVAKAHVGRWPLMSPLQKLVACEELAGVRFRGQGVVEVDPTGRWERGGGELARGPYKMTFEGFDVMRSERVAWNFVKINSLSTAARLNFMSEVSFLANLTAEKEPVEVRAVFDDRWQTFTEVKRDPVGLTEVEFETSNITLVPVWKSQGQHDSAPDSYPYRNTRSEHEIILAEAKSKSAMSSDLLRILSVNNFAKEEDLEILRELNVREVQDIDSINIRSLMGKFPLVSLQRLKRFAARWAKKQRAWRLSMLTLVQSERQAREEADEERDKLERLKAEMVRLGRDDKAVMEGEVERAKARVKKQLKIWEDREYWLKKEQEKLYAAERKGCSERIGSDSDSGWSEDEDEDEEDEVPALRKSKFTSNSGGEPVFCADKTISG